ncbi:MAG: TetR/AcrR family transcriptional regulator [bacterium]|nr:TetR/AcrR family transcriptional regulator [bacterium]
MVSKGEATRNRILDQALELASVVGLDGLSIGELAKATGMSKSGLFAHFDSKEDLQLQVLHLARDRFVAVVFTPSVREPRGEPRIRALFENWLAWELGRIPGGCPFVAVSHELDDQPGPTREALVEVQHQWINTLAAAVGIAVDEGQFKADVDAHQLAYDIYAIFLAFHLYHRLLRDDQAIVRARASFENLIRAVRI